MNKTLHSQPELLDTYTFLWSEARLVIASIALLSGGVPVLMLIFKVSFFFGAVRMILALTWIISGIASLYLLYRWYQKKWRLFGRKELIDQIAFLVSCISGINLGLTGLTGNNLGLSLTSSYGLLILTAFLYLWSAFHLAQRWRSSGKRIFF
ncbi:MAG: hypothetical protein KGZ30_01065 [Anaplasmataceae bacterium]|nr:hypothetical protein [Anaplasmataceae bacterium]